MNKIDFQNDLVNFCYPVYLLFSNNIVFLPCWRTISSSNVHIKFDFGKFIFIELNILPDFDNQNLYTSTLDIMSNSSHCKPNLQITDKKTDVWLNGFSTIKKYFLWLMQQKNKQMKTKKFRFLRFGFLCDEKNHCFRKPLVNLNFGFALNSNQVKIIQTCSVT